MEHFILIFPNSNLFKICIKESPDISSITISVFFQLRKNSFFSLSIEIIAEMSEDIIIYCLIDSSEQSIAYSIMENEGLDMRNIEFVYADTDSYWTRDYGPWWIVNGENTVSIVDFTYNRPRINDNRVPLKISEHLDVPYFATDVIHAGGNYMTDGYGISVLIYFKSKSKMMVKHKKLLKKNIYTKIVNVNSKYFIRVTCGPLKIMRKILKFF